MFQFIDLFFLEVSTQWVFGLMSHLEACVHSAYLFVPRHTVIHSISLSFLCCYLSLSSPFFCPSTIGPGQYPEETLDLDRGPRFRDWIEQHSSMGVVTGVEEVDGGGCVCVLGWGWCHVEAVGKHSFGRCCCCCWGLPLEGLEVNKREGWWELPMQEWWRLVSATVRNGRRERWRLIEVREVVQIWRVEGGN